MKRSDIKKAFPSLYDRAYQDGYKAAMRDVRRLMRHEMASGIQKLSISALYRKLERGNK